jgi:hypothetical protein
MKNKTIVSVVYPRDIFLLIFYLWDIYDIYHMIHNFISWDILVNPKL